MAVPMGITPHVIHDQGVSCAICAGNANMVLGMGAGHLRGKGHRRQIAALLTAGLDVPADAAMLQPGPVRQTLVGRCLWCSLNPDGTTRTDEGYEIPPTAWAEHLAGRPHTRRTGDGRLEAYVARRPPGPHVRMPGDAW